ncbi:uncharacterized protein LOC124490729 isoform X1 [Dermatophagoides farinae]|uniref:uncharacterized protein LOC124490729 isoform X1 n=1 Tax=Dermatophagoides farinae TaxID=6954 RepID=UPI003F62F8AE
MSSLLLSQSIISSTENSLREKSLQRKIHQHQHQQHLHPNHIGRYNPNFSVDKHDSYQYGNNRPRLIVTDVHDRQSSADISKFCWLIFISVLVLIFYLLIFSLISLICYVLFIWIPNDIERNKLNNELYDSIVIGEPQNMLLVGQLPQYDRKLLWTKNLYVFESKQTEDLMNLATKPLLLQNRYPALFWNEDFRSIIINDHVTGAIWLNDLGDLIFVFMAPLNETTISIVRFQPSINHIRTEIQTINPNESILPISSIDPGTELRLIQTKNGTSIKVLINQDNIDRFLCLHTVNETLRRIDLSEQICPNSSMLWPHFNVGYGNGTSLHLFTEQKQQVLIVPENVLYRLGVEYHFEFIEISQLISNRLFPLIGDWIIIAVASSILFIMIVLVLKYMMMKRHRPMNNNNVSSSFNNGSDETHPLLNRRSNRNDDEMNGCCRFKWTSLLSWCQHCHHQESCHRLSSNNATITSNIRSSDRRHTEPAQNAKNYVKI